MTIAEIKQAMFLLQMKDRLGPHGFAQMDAYARQIHQLEDMLASRERRGTDGKPRGVNRVPALTECG